MVLHRLIPAAASFGCVIQQGFEPGQMIGGNLVSAGKIAEECMDRCHVQRRSERFQFAKQDVHQSRYRLFELCSLTNLIESVICE